MKKKYSLLDINKSLKEKDSLITVYLLDPIAKPLLWLISNYTSLTPNIITSFSLILWVLWFVLWLYGYLFLAVLFYYFSFLFDCIDWKLSRLTNNQSKVGALFDWLVWNIVVGLYMILLIYVYIDLNNVFAIIMLFLIIYTKYTLLSFNFDIFKIKWQENSVIKVNNITNKNTRAVFFPQDVEMIDFLLIMVNLLFLWFNNLFYSVIILLIVLFYYLFMAVWSIFIKIKKIK